MKYANSSRESVAFLTSGSEAPTIERQCIVDEDGLYELIDGELVEKANIGFEAGATAARLVFLLSSFVSENNLGLIASEVSYRCFPNKPDQVRRPNISFVSIARLPQVPSRGHMQIIPDLAVEVIAPGDLVYEVDSKLADYRAAKFPLVWVVSPHTRTVQVYHFGKNTLRLNETDELIGEDILPGFSIRVAELFPRM